MQEEAKLSTKDVKYASLCHGKFVPCLEKSKLVPYAMENPSYRHVMKEAKHSNLCMEDKDTSLHMRAKGMAELCIQQAKHECSRGLLKLRVKHRQRSEIHVSSKKGNKAPSRCYIRSSHRQKLRA
jgi:hypothetical protein